MTNFEKIKNMSFDEMVNFILSVMKNPDDFDNDICLKYCSRRGSGTCSVETCPYGTYLETVKFWLENEA